MTRIFALVIIVIATVSVGSPLMAQTDTLFTYQGELKQNGGLATGSFNMSFSLWDARVGGNQLDQVTPLGGVQVVAGKFSVELDFGASALDNSNRWLEISVDGFTLSPRNPITRSPYSIQTRGIFVNENSNVGIGTSAPSYPLHVESGVESAIFGLYTGSSGSKYGVFGRTDSTASTRGVFGYATAPSGFTSGVQGRSNSTSGTGVSGFASATSGVNYGVLGETNSSDGYAGYFVGGRNYFEGYVGIGTQSPAYKLHVESAINVTIYGGSIAGRGVQGTSSSGTGVFGEATGINETNTGVFGYSHSSAGRGVQGVAEATGGTNYGVYGRSNSANGFDFYADGAGVNYGASSSRRWKSNVLPIGDPLDTLSKLQGVYFDWDKEHGGAHDVGMIAEQVGVVLPEIVQYEKNGVDAIGMDYSKMTPLLVEAVNALRAEKDSAITSLRAETTSLRAEITTLQAENSDLRVANEEFQQRFTRLESLVSRLTTENN